MPIATPFSGLSSNTKGAIFMLGSALCLASAISIIKYLTVDIHAMQLVFFRNLFGVIFILPWFLLNGASTMKTERIGLHFLRAMAGMGAMFCLFSAVELIPMAEATAVTFSAPLIAVVGSYLILKERPSFFRWVAVIVGLIGTCLILKPGYETLAFGAIFAAAAAILTALVSLTVKALSRTESPLKIVLFFNVLALPVSFVMVIFVWETPSVDLWLMIFVMSVLTTAHQLLFTKALEVADASLMLPIDFTQIIFVTILGIMFYSELPDFISVVGTIIILTSTVLMMNAEKKKPDGIVSTLLAKFMLKRASLR